MKMKPDSACYLLPRVVGVARSPWGRGRLRANNFRLQSGAKPRIVILRVAGLAQLVARHLAKVEVAGSNPVARSMHEMGPVLDRPFLLS